MDYMDYNEFKCTFKKAIAEAMAEEDVEVKEDNVTRVNETLDALSFVKKYGEQKMGPILYLQDLYNKYLKSNDIYKVVAMAKEILEKAFQNMPTNCLSYDKESILKNGMIQLVNTEMNLDLLAKVPHRKILDLSMVFRWMIPVNEEQGGSLIVTNQMMESLGITEAELYKAAYENTKADVKVGTIDDLVPFVINADLPDDKKMWILSNKKNTYGASAMLCEEELYRLSCKLGTDLVILPSSIHEVIAISTNFGEAHEFSKMVEEINQKEVALNEQLSNNVYLYKKDARKLVIG